MRKLYHTCRKCKSKLTEANLHQVLFIFGEKKDKKKKITLFGWKTTVGSAVKEVICDPCGFKPKPIQFFWTPEDGVCVLTDEVAARHYAHQNLICKTYGLKHNHTVQTFKEEEYKLDYCLSCINCGHGFMLVNV